MPAIIVSHIPPRIGRSRRRHALGVLIRIAAFVGALVIAAWLILGE